MATTRVTIHKTMGTGAQLGYCRTGDTFRFASRPDVVTPWQVHSQQYRSWVEIADAIDQRVRVAETGR